MTKIYFDFDGTLFNTDQFYQDFLQICFKYNITNEMINQAKEQLFSSKKFDMDEIINYFSLNYQINPKIKEEIKELYSNKYLFDDVINNLIKLKTKYELFILTLGNFNYQTNKINGCKIKEYFSKIIITEIDKSNLEDIDYLNGIFIDNNPNEVKKYFNKGVFKVIRIRRDLDKYSVKDTDNDINILEYKTLDDISNLLMNN